MVSGPEAGILRTWAAGSGAFLFFFSAHPAPLPFWPTKLPLCSRHRFPTQAYPISYWSGDDPCQWGGSSGNGAALTIACDISGHVINLVPQASPTSGDIPSLIGTLTALKVLTLYNGVVSGTLPSELALCSQLLRVTAYTTLISGLLPSELGRLSLLSSLDLHYSSMSGTIPPEWGGMTSLTSLLLSGLFLSSTLPTEARCAALCCGTLARCMRCLFLPPSTRKRLRIECSGLPCAARPG